MIGKQLLLLACIGALAASGEAKCVEGSKNAVPNTCRGYEVCSGGKMQLEACGWLMRFEEKSGSCKFWWKVNCSKVVCLEGSRSPVAGDCHSYKTCRGGKWSKTRCGIFRKFNPVSNSCEFRYDCRATPDCEDGDKKQDKTSNRSYSVCHKGKWTNNHCIWPFRYFDSVTKRCVHAATVLKQECTGSWKQPVRGNCQLYSECVGGKVVQKSCRMLMRFDRVKQECRFRWLVSCQDKPTVKPHTDNDKCKEYARRPVPGDCKKYSECQGGTWIVQDCLLDGRFDSVTLTCKKVKDAVCSQPGWKPNFMKLTCNPGETRAVTRTCSGFELCKEGLWRYTNCPGGSSFDHIKSLCVPLHEAQCLRSDCEESSIVADITDCSKFKVCVAGSYVSRSCRILQSFDAISGRCVWSNGATCANDLLQGVVEAFPEQSTKEPTAAPKTTEEPPAPPKTTEKPTAPPKTTEEPTAPPKTTEEPPTTPSLCPKGTKYGVEGSCKDYRTCELSTGHVNELKCKWCQNFDPVALKCVYAWKYRCQDGSTPMGKGTTRPPPTGTPSCQEGTRVPVDCKNYNVCVGGRWEPRKCSWYNKFDIKTLKCKMFAKC